MAGRFKMHRSAARARDGHSPSDRLLYSGEGSREASEIRGTDHHSAAVAHHVFVDLVVGRPGMVASTKLLACQDMTTRLRSSNRTTPAVTGRSTRKRASRTKKKTDLCADNPQALYHSFMHRGSAVAPVGNSEETERALTPLSENSDRR
jgi:hypothetical protein